MLEDGLRGRDSSSDPGQWARGGGESGGFSNLEKYSVISSDMRHSPIDTGTSSPVTGILGSIDSEEWLLMS